MSKWSKAKEKLINRETVLYTFFGLTTTIVGIVIYRLMLYWGIDYKISNFCSLVLGKLYAYAMNKTVVFRSKSKDFIDFCKEFLRFLLARGATGLIDYFGVIFAVEICGIDKVISKYFFTILVIILNYFVGKKVVFRKE